MSIQGAINQAVGISAALYTQSGSYKIKTAEKQAQLADEAANRAELKGIESADKAKEQYMSDLTKDMPGKGVYKSNEQDEEIISNIDKKKAEILESRANRTMDVNDIRLASEARYQAGAYERGKDFQGSMRPGSFMISYDNAVKNAKESLNVAERQKRNRKRGGTL